MNKTSSILIILPLMLQFKRFSRMKFNFAGVKNLPNSVSVCHNNSSFSEFVYYGKEGICSTDLHVPGLEANRLTVTENLFLLLRINSIFSIFSFSFLLFKIIFFICPYFPSNCLIVLSTES